MSTDTLSLNNLSKAFAFEDDYMERLVSQSNSTTTNKTLSFVLEHPEVLAPISMVLSSGIASTEGLFYKAINKEKIANEDRKKFLKELCGLNGYPYEKLNWAKAQRIDYFMSWFMPLFNERHNHLKKLHEVDESDQVESRVKLYELVVRELDHMNTRIKEILDSYSLLSDDEKRSYNAHVEQQKPAFQSELSELDRESKKNELQFKSLLIGEKTFQQVNSLLTEKRNAINNKYCCHAHGCNNLASNNSQFCFDHKCKEPKCNHKTFSAPTDMGDAFINQALGAVLKVAGNANTGHFMDTGKNFCDYHNADLSLDAIKWTETHFNPKTGKSELSEDELPPSLGARFMQLIGILFAIGILFYLFGANVGN